ncbi:MAG TPA: alpha/beta fold hydrolase [Nocardioidaceae bacterium]
MQQTVTTRRVRSRDLWLSVREHGSPGPRRQSLVLVHGYPDQQDVWDDVVAALDQDTLHVVTYDVRGAGASGVPGDRSGYRAALLVDDLAAVVQATVPPDRPVHLAGHDWGSVQLWDAVSDQRGHPALTGRIASYTSISGPSLDHVATLARRGGMLRAAPRQALRSWYVYAFHVPAVPDLLWRHGHRAAGRLLARLEGLSGDRWGPELPGNAVNGLELYRANVLPRLREALPLSTKVPVQVLQPRRDRYVTGALLRGLEEACSDLTVKELDAAHWVMLSRPREVAALLQEHVLRNAG